MDAELIHRVGQSDLGAVASVRALEQGMGDLTARLDAYNVYAPKQARWQAELLLSDLAQDPHVATAASNLGAISSAAGKASGSIDRMPEYDAASASGSAVGCSRPAFGDAGLPGPAACIDIKPRCDRKELPPLPP